MALNFKIQLLGMALALAGAISVAQLAVEAVETVWSTQARTMEQKGAWNIAVDFYSESIKVEPSASSYYNRGRAFSNLKQYQQAIADFGRAIALDPKNPLPYLKRGRAYCGLKQYELAIQDFNKTLALDPKIVQAYNSRGEAYYTLKQFPKAIEDYAKALSMSAASTVDAVAAGLKIGERDRGVQISDKEAAQEEPALSEAEKAYKEHSMRRNQIASRIKVLWREEGFLKEDYQYSGERGDLPTNTETGRDLRTVRQQIDSLRAELSRENAIIQKIGEQIPD